MNNYNDVKAPSVTRCATMMLFFFLAVLVFDLRHIHPLLENMHTYFLTKPLLLSTASRNNNYKTNYLENLNKGKGT